MGSQRVRHDWVTKHICMPCQVRIVYYKETACLSYSAVMPHYSLCSAILLSHVWLFATPWTLAHQVPLSMGFSRKEHWSGLAMPSSRRSSQPRDQTQVSHIAGRFFTIWATREAHGILFLSIILIRKYYLLDTNYPSGVKAHHALCILPHLILSARFCYFHFKTRSVKLRGV